MKKTLRKLAIVFAAALMVMMMAVPSFAVTYPLKTTVYFYSQGGNVTQYGGDIISVPAVSTGAQVTYQTGFTTNYVIPFPAPTGAYNPYTGVQPTVMDAVYDTYYALNNYSNTGINIGWDTVNTPNGAYADKIWNINEITEDIGYSQGQNYWTGYAWHIYKNGTPISQYASNVTIQNNDVIYVIYEESTEYWN